MAKEIVLIDHVKRLEIEEERLPIFEALTLLEDVNKKMVSSKLTGSCRIRIYNRKNQLLHSMELQFPLNNAIEEVISTQYRLVENSRFSLEKVKAEKRINTFTKIKESYQKRKRNIAFSPSIKRVLFAVAILVGLTMVGKLTYSNFFEKINQEENLQIATLKEWEVLLENQLFIDAAESYPKKLPELIDYLTETKEFVWLKKVNERYPSKDAEFDLAFFDKDWRRVVETHPETLSEKRQVMLALAYLELNKLTEAELLNKRLESEELTGKLDQGYLKQGMFYLKEKNISKSKEKLALIQDTELKKLLQIYIDHAKIINDFIQLYSQNKDNENRLLWEQRLEKLGDEDYLNAQ